MSKDIKRLRRGWRDQTLDPELEPPLGAHLVTPRRAYTHHGIYVGLGRVVQYGGLSRGLGRGACAVSIAATKLTS
jgi:lecithin:retinol acyltransferase